MALMRLDREVLRQQYCDATPFPFVTIDDFLNPAFAGRVAAAYPSFEEAIGKGKVFKGVNERKKVQITDSSLFANPVSQLNECLASHGFLSDLSYITGIGNLIADENLTGAGMHITAPRGRLDVHVDFNYLKDRKLYRRLNLLLYLNPQWEEEWGGHIELWDKDVKNCQQSFSPKFNRCVIFETSKISFHGVTPVTKAAPFPRISFATYYYTREPSDNWGGSVHSTIFKARPEERIRRYFLMPVESIQRRCGQTLHQIKRRARRLFETSH